MTYVFPQIKYKEKKRMEGEPVDLKGDFKKMKKIKSMGKIKLPY